MLIHNYYRYMYASGYVGIHVSVSIYASASVSVYAPMSVIVSVR